MKLNLGKKHIDIKVAKSFTEKLTGLIGKTNINYGLLIPKCNSIHTYFMKEPIDVIVLDSQNKVVFKIVALPKNKAYKADRPQNNTSILELPANSSTNIKLGQKLNFENW